MGKHLLENGSFHGNYGYVGEEGYLREEGHLEEVFAMDCGQFGLREYAAPRGCSLTRQTCT
jgi:hypothetical protein